MKHRQLFEVLALTDDMITNRHGWNAHRDAQVSEDCDEYEAYQKWCFDNGLDPMTFGEWLAHKEQERAEEALWAPV